MHKLDNYRGTRLAVFYTCNASRPNTSKRAAEEGTLTLGAILTLKVNIKGRVAGMRPTEEIGNVGQECTKNVPHDELDRIKAYLISKLN